jgi:hypothetical protein
MTEYLGFWAHPLLEQRSGLLDQRQLGLQLPDPAPSRSQVATVDVPGMPPRSMRSWALHRYTVASASPNSAATTRTGQSARTSSMTRRRNSGS